MREVELRAWACNQTLEAFNGKPFDWNGASCVDLLHAHGQNMGHEMPEVPKFKTALGAKQAIKKLGCEDLPGVLNGMFESIPPAMMRTGDIMAIKGDQGFHALVIRVAPTKFIGWHESAPGVTVIDIDMNQAVGAWRL